LPLLSSAQDLEPESSGLRKTPIWLQHYGSGGFLSTSLVYDGISSLYIGGTFKEYIKLPDSLLRIDPRRYRVNFANQPFVQKHDLRGNLQWTIFADGDARLHDMAIDPDGSIVFVGEVWSKDLVFVSADGSRDSLVKPQPLDHGCYVARFSADGQYIDSYYHQKLRGGTAQSVAITDNGSVILAGHHFYREGSESKRNWMIIQLFKDFSPLGVWLGDSTGRSSITDLIIDSKGETFLCGWYSTELNFYGEQRKTLSSDQKGFIARLNTDGDLEWINDHIIWDPLAPGQFTLSQLAIDHRNRVYFIGNAASQTVLGRISRRGKPKWFKRSQGRTNTAFGMTLKGKDGLVAFGHGYGGSFFGGEPDYDWKGPWDISYQSAGSTDFFVLDTDRKGNLDSFLVGGGRGTDYASAAVWINGRLFLLGHDLGGPEIRMGQMQVPTGSARLWLACFDWP